MRRRLRYIEGSSRAAAHVEHEIVHHDAGLRSLKSDCSDLEHAGVLLAGDHMFDAGSDRPRAGIRLFFGFGWLKSAEAVFLRKLPVVGTNQINFRRFWVMSIEMSDTQSLKLTQEVIPHP